MAQQAEELVAFTVDWLSKKYGQPVNPEVEFVALGLDSLDLVRLINALAERVGVDELPVSLMFDHPSVSSLAEHLVTIQPG